MRQSMERRLRRLHQHIHPCDGSLPSPRQPAAAASAALRQRHPAPCAPPPPLLPKLLLPESAVRQFIATGFLAFEVKTPELPNFHEDFYGRLLDLRQGGAGAGQYEEGGGQFGEGALALASDAVLRSPSTRGVLHSLLGRDYIASAWNGGVLTATDKDQGYHKGKFLPSWHTQPRPDPC